MKCAEIRTLLAFRPVGALEEDELGPLDRHLEECAPCREEARAIDEALTALQAPEVEVPLPASVRAKVALAIRELPRSEAPAAPPAAAVTIALSCAFCHDALARAEAAYCASCLAPHHGDCWRQHGRCSALGCEETRTVRPALEPVAPPRKRSSAMRKGALGLLVLGSGSVAAVAAYKARVESVRSRELAVNLSAARAQVAEADKDRKVWNQASDLEKRIAEGLKDLGRTGKLDLSKLGQSKDGGFSYGPSHHRTFKNTVDADFDDGTDLAEAVAEIASQSGRTIFLGPNLHVKLPEPIVLDNAPWDTAVEALAKACQCVAVRLVKDCVLLTRPPRVTIHAFETVREAVRRVTAAGGKSVIVSPECSPVVRNVNLVDQDWFLALGSILKTYDAHAVMVGSIIVVLPGAGPELSRDDVEPMPAWPHLPGLEEDVTVHFADTALGDALTQIRRLVARVDGLEPMLVAAPEALGEKVSLDATEAPYDHVVLALAYLTRCELNVDGETVILCRPPKVALGAVDTPAALWLEAIFGYAKRKVVVASDITGTVSADLYGVDWETALEATVFAGGYTVSQRMSDGVYTVTAPPRRR